MGVKKNHFVEILKKTWDKFKQKHPSYATDYYNEVVDKSVHCRDPARGYVEYTCMRCGRGHHRVGMSCKSKFCIHCARKSSMDFIEEMMGKLHPGVVYRHLILTIPEQLRKLFYVNRKEGELYSRFIRIAKDFIEDVFRYVTGIKKLKIGCVVVLHLAGRPGGYNPHLHVIVMNGGIDPDTGKWVELPYFRYKKILPRKWQYHLLTMIKGFDSSAETLALVKGLWKKYKKGFVANFKKGNVPKNNKHLVNYLAKYISKPSISIRSIIDCDYEKERVVYKYLDHRTNKHAVMACNFITFIGRLAQQIFPKGFHRLRYFGLQHPSGYQATAKEISEGLRKIGRVEGDETFVAYAVGNWQWAKDPRKCEHCGSDLELSKIWSKRYGVIFDIFLNLLREGIPPPEEDCPSDNFQETITAGLLDSIGEQLSFSF